MNIKRVMVWGQFFGGIACSVIGLAIVIGLMQLSRIPVKLVALGVIMVCAGPWLMITSYQRGCARCLKALTDTNLLFPITQLDGIRQDVQNGTTTTLSHPQPINRQEPRFACIKGGFCAACGDIALVEVGEQIYTRPNDERSGKFVSQGGKREISGAPAQAIKQMSMVVATTA